MGDDRASTPVRPAALPTSIGPARVLVVDDSPSDQRLITETAVEAGADRHAIVCVPTLADARLVLTERPVDIILLDLSLPDAVGLEGVAVLAAAAPDVPIVVVTGQPADSLVYAATAEGADEYLCKNDLEPNRLLDVLLRASERRRGLRRRRLPDVATASVLDSVEAAMAILDGTGRILVVNKAWSAAATDGGATADTTGVGVNYLAVCDRAAGPDASVAAAAAEGIRAVLHGVRDRFSLDYRCDDGSAERWCSLRVSPLGELGGGALVSHVDVTELKVAEHRLRGDDPRLHALYDDSAPIFTLLGADGTVLHVSDSTTRLLGLRPEERVGMDAFSTLDPVDAEQARAVFTSVLATPGSSESVTLRAMDGAGRRRELDLVVMNLLEDPSVQAMVVSGCDVTDARLHQIARRLESTLLQRLPAGVVVTDERSHVVYWNDQAAALYGYAAEEALGRPIDELQIGLMDPAMAAVVRETVAQRGRWEGEFEASRKDGSALSVHAVVERVDDDEIGFHGIVGATVDISARRQLEDDLAFQALHDPLTGLPNRRLFIDHLEHALSRNERNNTRTAVLFIDLDDFKQVNDQIGHAAGDEVLLAVGELIQSVLRAGDLVARLGGDEFVVCCSDLTDLTDIDAVAARILQVMTAPFRADGASLVLSASIGVALSGPSSHADGIMRNADAAMYVAKDAGKNRVEVFDDGMHASVRRRHQLARELREGMAAGQILTLFQPEVHLGSSELFGFEALARWSHPERGLVSPDAFIGVAEESGLIVELGRIVLRDACDALASWLVERDGHPLTVSVNVSARQLSDPDFPRMVQEIVAGTGIPAALLCLEVTETALIEADKAIETLTELKAIGVQIAIDDFGTGYSSLSRLRSFPLDFLKIDRTFVDGMTEQAEDAVIVSAVLSLAAELGLQTVAEGIEDEEQLRQLAEKGCDIGQGYLWSRPIPLERANRLVASRGPVHHDAGS